MEGTLCMFRAWLHAKLPSERGASMVEYGLLLALVAIIALVAVQLFGQGVSAKYSIINTSVAGS